MSAVGADTARMHLPNAAVVAQGSCKDKKAARHSTGTQITKVAVIVSNIYSYYCGTQTVRLSLANVLIR